MTELEYRSHPAISRSELWKIHESPAKFYYSKEHPEESTPALLFGQVFHKLELESETFWDEFILKPYVNRRTTIGKEQWSSFLDESKGKTVIESGMYAQAKAMCEALAAEPFAVKLLSGAREVPFFWIDRATGETCKCRIDCLNTNYNQPIIVDLKSTADAGTETFIRDSIKYGYDFQAAMYTEGVENNLCQTPLFVFIVVEKTPPYAVNILQADNLFINRGRILFRDFMDTYHDCRVTGNWYGYLGKQNQINTLSLPTWLAREYE